MVLQLGLGAEQATVSVIAKSKTTTNRQTFTILQRRQKDFGS